MLTREQYINSPVKIQSQLLYLFSRDQELVIFDIGACEGEDSIRYSNLFPRAIVHAFEPRTDNITKARELFQQYKRSGIVLNQIALSYKNGTAEFFLSAGEPEGLKNDEKWNYGNKSSSLLPPSEEMKKHTAWLKFADKIEVPTVKLEDYVAKHGIKIIDFVHMDVQGAELLVLEGAGHFVDHIRSIWLEVEEVELYKGQPLKNDVEQFMRNNGFINILDTVNHVSGDQFYVNKKYFSVQEIAEVKAIGKNGGFLSRLKRFIKSKA